VFDAVTGELVGIVGGYRTAKVAIPEMKERVLGYRWRRDDTDPGGGDQPLPRGLGSEPLPGTVMASGGG
jgi:hypothetical protein